MKRIYLLLLLAVVALSALAQRKTDKLDRGLVATISATGSGNFVSWRIFAEEYYDTKYNLYANGSLIAKNLTVSNYVHSGGNASTTYQVAPVVRGTEGEKSAAVKRWSGTMSSSFGNAYYGYMDVQTQPVYDRKGHLQTSNYELNDVSLADVDGDGIAELIVKRNYTPDNCSVNNDSAYNHIECYKVDGTRLWWIDLGPNMVSGPDEQYDVVGFDWDQDGKAELVMRAADDVVLHKADGSTQTIGTAGVNTRGSVNQTANMTYTNTGAEYLLYLNGETLEPYQVMTYPLARGSASDWGDGYGHRSTKHYFGAPFLDGRNPYIFLARGCYTKHAMIAYSVNPSTHALTKYWSWSCADTSSPYYGQGYHNYAIADVDMDGRDEIVFGSMVIDDNGKGLSTTGLGHGDAQHCGDLDPYRWGLEQFACNEDKPAMNYRNATTSKIYYRATATSDDGRALVGNFSNKYPGCQGRSISTGMVSTTSDKVISALGEYIGYSDLNFRIYWDGDLCDEILNSPGTGRQPKIEKPGTGRIFLGDGNMNNGSKNNPCAQGDIFGDWREEIVIRVGSAMRIYTTNYPTSYPIYTLWHDHQYRNAMVWQSVGYNQPPHVSYFLGDLEGITVAPPPLTLTNRTEIANGGTISSATDGKQVIVCETGNTEVQVAEGAKPWVAIFNVPSWVQGTGSTSTTNPTINYTYYNCNVSGSAFTSDTRVVKQGEGKLTLPSVEQTYTGPTEVWGGTLRFDGKLTQSNLWLNRHTTLISNGGTFKNISAEYGSTIQIGEDAAGGTLTCDTLSLGFGARLKLDFNADDNSADQLSAKTVTIETKSWDYGPEYLTPVIECNNIGSNDPATGKILLGTIGEVVGDISDIKLESNVPSTLSAKLAMEDGNLYLVIDPLRNAGDITWTGSQSNDWDLAQTTNFVIDSEQTTFVTGDKVTFDDTATQFNVNLTDDLEADSVIVDNTKAYTFSGNGSISGKTTLVKRGTGTLTVKTDNSYTGGTRISGGTLSVSSLANANLASGNLGAVSTSNSKFIIENGAELKTTAAVTQGSPMKIVGDDGGVLNNSADFNTTAAISGTTLNKKGSGWLKLNTNNTSLNELIISGGTMQCVSCTTPAKTVVFKNGTLYENAGSNYAINVPEGGKGTWYLAERSTYSNKLTGAGTITISCPGVVGSGWVATRTPIQGNWSAFEGTVVPTSSNDTRFTLNTATGMPLGKFDIPSGIVVENSGKTYQIGQVTGSGSLGGTCSFSNSGSSGTNTWKVGNADDFTFAGTVTSTANFEKVGEGKMKVSGKWDNTGTVKVSEGELAFTSGATLGTGTLTVAKGARLSGNATKTKPLENSAVTVNGEIQVGQSATATTGVITLDNKNVTIGSSGTYIVGVAGCAKSSSANAAILSGVNRMTINGTIKVFLKDGYEPQAGDSIRVFDAASFSGSPTYDLPTFDNNWLAWDTSRISEGLLFLQETTGIDTAISEKSPADIYNTRGQLIRRRATTTKGLPTGVYLIRGQKITVK